MDRGVLNVLLHVQVVGFPLVLPLEGDRRAASALAVQRHGFIALYSSVGPRRDAGGLFLLDNHDSMVKSVVLTVLFVLSRLLSQKA